MRKLPAVALAGLAALSVWGSDESLSSPDGRLAVSFASDARGMRWALARDGKPAVVPSRLGLVFARAKPLAEMRVTKVSRRSEDSTWENRLYRRRTVRDRFNEMTVELEETEPRAERMPIGATEAEPVARRLTLVFRAYDEGVAFRYVVPEQRAFECFQLMGEETEWRFPSAVTGWTTTYKSEFTSQEEAFEHGPIGAIAPEKYIGSPVLVETQAGTLGLCEAALANWAGMFFRAKADASAHETVLSAALARLPPSDASVPGVAVIRRTPAASPWRVAMAGDDELDLLRKNDILVNLNPPPEPGLDFDWVKPGATSWDWWVESNNSISTDLELRLVDFAAEMGWPYHTIDGGWYGYGRRGPNHGPDVRLEPCAGFDLERIVVHAQEKGVGIFVWAHWMMVDDTGVEETFARLARWGVRGIKIDFISRQDQWIVNWYERVCRAAARHHVLVNFHGAFKPTGTERTWPNNVNREGIRGNEMNIFNSQNTPAHAATLPFTRFLIGPGDYTPGGFDNVFSKDFVPQTRRGHRYGDPTDRRPIWAEQMGTRAQALALSVAFDGPVTTLCDWPERYRGADGIEALRGLPTVWKSTEPLAGRCGEFYEVVRESPDGRFYLASFTVKARTASVKLDFLGEGEWTMRAYADDPARTPTDAKAIRTVSRRVAKGDRIDFPLCDEGGLVAIFTPLSDVPCPRFPDRTFNAADYGARADGSDTTAAFRKAIEACAAAGGGRVVVPAGTYFTGPVHLKSNVDFHLDENAVLDFSDDPKACLPAVPSSWEGLECWNYSPLVYAYGCTNVALTGRGTLRPRMARWAEIMKESKTDIAAARAILYKWGSEDYPVEKRVMPEAHPAVMRPQLVQFNRAKNALIEGVRIRESPFWTIHLLLCENVTVRDVDVNAHGFNNDGIDIEMTRNVLIDGGVFEAGDDGFVFKAGRNRDAWRLGVPTENVHVRNAHVKFAHSVLCVGSEMSAGVRNVLVENCRVDKSWRLFYVKTNARRGGFVDDITLRDVKASKIDNVLDVDTDVLYQWRVLPTYEERITKISNLKVENVDVALAKNGIVVKGDARCPVDGIALKNVNVRATVENPFVLDNVRNIDLSGLRLGDVRKPGLSRADWNKMVPASSGAAR